MLISNNIVKLSTRSYRQRMESLGSNQYNKRQLAQLNRDLDEFYELLYSQWRTVTEDDYKVFGPQLKVMLRTLRELYNTCRKMPKVLGLEQEIEKLDMNYSAISELNNDIENFRIKVLKDTEFGSLMECASEVMATIKL